MFSRNGLIVALGGLCFAGMVLASSASAFPVAKSDQLTAVNFETVQYSRAESRAISRCMRKKYGRQYSRRSQYRFHMLQTCS